MAIPIFNKSQPSKYSIFLNTCFLLILSFFVTTFVYSPTTSHAIFQPRRSLRSWSSWELSNDGCSGVHDFSEYKLRCIYVNSHDECHPRGYINYLSIFYCICGQFPVVGYAVLLLWLLVLFYLLGDTAANYFCFSLESLSRLLKLSPSIAGVTLLSLGNGAPDVFASIVSFTRSGAGDVGLNSVLGGAFFVSNVVVGIISIVISSRNVSVDKSSFTRDVLFFLFSLSSLLVIIYVGKVNLFGAISFISIYLIYVSTVSATHFCGRVRKESSEISESLLSPTNDNCSNNNDNDKSSFMEKGRSRSSDHDHQKLISSKLDSSSACCYLDWFLYILDLPLYLPRRLTIPVAIKERWSKPYAVISASLAPVLLAALWSSQREEMGSKTKLVINLIGGLIGIVLGNVAYLSTKETDPPKNGLFFWLAGGFFMSVTWTYIIAEELVSLLVSIGTIVGISPSILGLTVLAWGISLGDLISNLAMAMNGGADGAQIAISGCYAGPMFNTLVGIGLSLIFSTSSTYPNPYVIPDDPSLYETIGFLMTGLVWALVILPRKNMKLDRLLGTGLLTTYLCFLSLRFSRAVGLLKSY
ncbi:Sodium/calcium exchanger membrane region [Dillenia turbinata]|uniref:Sodium/calcium exchanger membrane region n=1 Tax=Dillenia turbinata TaxID=194707 RepID=A0AAN8WA78_9MAGN